MKLNKKTDYLLVFDDVAVEMRNGERTYRAIITRERYDGEERERLGAFNATGVDDLVGTAKMLGLRIKMGYFSDDGQGYGMARRLERAATEAGVLR